MLYEFIDRNRDEILTRAQKLVSARDDPPATASGAPEGLPLFLDQLGTALRRSASAEPVDRAVVRGSAGRLGGALFQEGLSV